ncbi:MAG TPA: hypothetical protein VFV50_13830, partial [Bdellovibrionales bacterium]|nr:hypothetical protein [Bdellovibrionales bacterium]
QPPHGRVRLARLRNSFYNEPVRTLHALLTIVFLALTPAIARAQTSETEQRLSPGGGSRSAQLGVNTGPFLVSGVSGVREILPFVGVRLGLPFRKMYFEATAMSGRTQGIEYHQGDVGFRFDFELDFIQYFALLGADFHYWKRVPTEWQEFPYRSGQGWHTGMGLFYPISEALSFRNDFKVNFGPGTSLYVSFGFVYHFESGGDEQPQQTTSL